MKRLALATLVLSLALSAAAKELTIDVRATAVQEIPGATAAYAVDAHIAEASARGGVVTIVGRSAGLTQVVVITAEGTQLIPVIVRLASANRTARTSSSAEQGTISTRYSSGVGQLQNTVTLSKNDGKRNIEAQLTSVNAVGAKRSSAAANAMTSATVRVTTPTRKLTLLDDVVDNSPLTMWGTSVRGVHLEQGRWRLHAGYTSHAVFETFVLAADREAVAGASYSWNLDERSRLTPSLYLFPTRSADRPHSRGAVASLMYDYRNGEALELRSELALSHRLGGALQLTGGSDRNRFRADMRYQPREFASAGPADLHGFYSDAAWSTRIGSRFTADVNVSANQYDLALFDQRSITGSASTRYTLTRALALTAGASYAGFTRDEGSDVRSVTFPVGLQAEFGRLGATVIARYTQSSDANRGAWGYRVAGRAMVGAVNLSGYYDYQPQAPTLSLILREHDELALALEQLGISVSSPEDIARIVRDNAALLELGVLQGISINLAPSRTQAGVEASWLGRSDWRPHLRLRLSHSRTETTAGSVASTIATLTYSQRITATTDVYAGVTQWISERDGVQNEVEPMFELGARKRFDGLPSLLRGERSGTISGSVFLDEELTGERGADTPPVEGIAVSLDGRNETVTTTDGRYRFDRVRAGSHRVVARLTAVPEGYFTTPSAVTAQPGETVDFGVARTPARLIAHVVSDAGVGVGNVTVSLVRNGRTFSEPTTSLGKATISAPPGEYEVSVNAESLAAGYSIVDGPQRVSIDRSKPTELSFQLRAARTISGLAQPGTEIEVLPHGRKTKSDAEGRFTFRSLPPGAVSVVAHSGKNVERTEVVLTNEPMAVTDLRFGGTPPPAPAEELTNVFVVQAGAFRNSNNATELVGRMRRAGVEASAVMTGGLTYVQSGKYPSRSAANAQRDRVLRAGFDAVVVRD